MTKITKIAVAIFSTFCLFIALHSLAPADEAVRVTNAPPIVFATSMPSAGVNVASIPVSPLSAVISNSNASTAYCEAGNTNSTSLGLSNVIAMVIVPAGQTWPMFFPPTYGGGGFTTGLTIACVTAYLGSTPMTNNTIFVTIWYYPLL